LLAILCSEVAIENLNNFKEVCLCNKKVPPLILKIYGYIVLQSSTIGFVRHFGYRITPENKYLLNNNFKAKMLFDI